MRNLMMGQLGASTVTSAEESQHSTPTTAFALLVTYVTPRSTKSFSSCSAFRVFQHLWVCGQWSTVKVFGDWLVPVTNMSKSASPVTSTDPSIRKTKVKIHSWMVDSVFTLTTQTSIPKAVAVLETGGAILLFLTLHPTVSTVQGLLSPLSYLVPLSHVCHNSSWPLIWWLFPVQFEKP
jgi:hypothetical protein